MDVSRSLITLILVLFAPLLMAVDESNDITDTDSITAEETARQCEKQCSKLKKIGDCQKPVACSSSESKSGVSSFFEVCKTGKNKITVHLNMTFYKNDDPNEENSPDGNKINREASKPGSAAAKMDKKWRDKIHSCLKRYKNRVGDGKRRLEIKIHPFASKKGSSNILMEVESESPGNFANQLNKNVSCSSIIHELGHHLGFPEGFRPHQHHNHGPGHPHGKQAASGVSSAVKWAYSSTSNFISNWLKGSSKKNIVRSCRPIGDKYSFMSDSKAAASGNMAIKYQMCECTKKKKGNLSGCKLERSLYNDIYMSDEADVFIKAAKPNSPKSNNSGCPTHFRPVGEVKTAINSVEGFRKELWDKQIQGNEGIGKAKYQGFPFFPVIVEAKPKGKGGGFQPKHLDSVELPNCDDTPGRKKYFECARSVYKRSDKCPSGCTEGKWTK